MGSPFEIATVHRSGHCPKVSKRDSPAAVRNGWHPFLESKKHTVEQIRAKLEKHYGVDSADRWFESERRRILDTCARDPWGIAGFATLDLFWENKQMEAKWGLQPKQDIDLSGKHCVELYTVRGPGSNGEIGVLTTSHELSKFISGLAAACAEYLKDSPGDEEHALHWIFTNAFPIAFKLSGYKADQVVERHVLMCGSSSPASDDIVAAA